jgi:hypothetical protein
MGVDDGDGKGVNNKLLSKMATERTKYVVIVSTLPAIVVQGEKCQRVCKLHLYCHSLEWYAMVVWYGTVWYHHIRVYTSKVSS